MMSDDYFKQHYLKNREKKLKQASDYYYRKKQENTHPCECGNPITKKDAKTCIKCLREKQKHTCADCDKKIRKPAIRCKECSLKKKKEPKICQTCGKEKEHRGQSKNECNSCYRKKKWNENKEENNRISMEYKRKKKGIPLDHPNMRDGSMGSVDKALGYKTVVAHGHPNAMGKKQRILEHVLVMSEFMERPLRKGESVHHLNGIRDDNRIENLELWDTSHPSGQRVVDKIAFYKEFLEFHGYSVT